MFEEKMNAKQIYKHKSSDMNDANKNIGLVSDIPVPKSYIIQELHKRYTENVSSYITEIENYITVEIQDTHLTHVSSDLKQHIDTLVSTFEFNTLVHSFVVNSMITIVTNIIEQGQIKVAEKKKKHNQIGNN